MGSTVDDQIMVTIIYHMTASGSLHRTELLTRVLCPQHSVKVVYLRGCLQEGQAQRGGDDTVSQAPSQMMSQLSPLLFSAPGHLYPRKSLSSEHSPFEGHLEVLSPETLQVL